jgi:hypothetical protein
MSGTAADVAKRLRDERASIVAAIATGAVDIGDLQGDALAAPVKVVVLAQAVPGVGKVRSRRALESLGVDDSERWGDIDPAMTDRIVAALRDAATEADA